MEFWTNQWTITVVGGILVGSFLYYILGIGKQKSARHNSQSISAGTNISAEGDITVGHHNIKHTTIHHNEIPEIHLQLYGSGANKTIEGHVEKKGDNTLVLELFEIKGFQTKFDQAFTKLTYLKNLNFPESLFTTKESHEIKARIVYRTLDGKQYELIQIMIQTDRADGLFNLAGIGTPKIKKLEERL